MKAAKKKSTELRVTLQSADAAARRARAPATDDAGTTRGRVGHAVLTIGQRIAIGVYAPGSTLPTEQEICEELDLGRNAVREAIKLLAGKGFVRTERRAGTFVQPTSRWSMLDPQVLSWVLGNEGARSALLTHLTDVRRIIEPEVAAAAAANATTTDKLRIFEAYERMERFANDRERAIEADVGFHEQMFEASHNPLLASLARTFAVLLRANFEVSIERKGGYIRNLQGHRLVAEAIHRRDARAARAAMLKLLANNDKDLKQMLAGRAGRAR